MIPSYNQTNLTYIILCDLQKAFLLVLNFEKLTQEQHITKHSLTYLCGPFARSSLVLNAGPQLGILPGSDYRERPIQDPFQF